MRWFIAMMMFGGWAVVQAAPDSGANGKDEKKPAESEKSSVPSPVTRLSSVMIDGKKISYKVTSGKIQLKQDDGKPRASIFNVTYERTDVQSVADRPVVFAFNGGPGSSSVWLHIGVLGPRRLDLPGDGTVAPTPPVRTIENASSILDVCDLVFIDPVSTGYSREDGDAKADEFHGLDGDIESIGDFIRRWTTEHDRWASPKFLLGESYGGIRAAGLAEHLQTRYGMSLNGVVLLSSLLDFSTLQPAPGNDLSYLVYLPAYAGAAHYHGKIQGDRDALIKSATDYAFTEYAAALLKGSSLEASQRDAVAAKLASFTGIPAQTWIEQNLRLSPMLFRGLLLKDTGKVLGRFDGRVAWDSSDRSDPYPGYDPSYSLTQGAFSTAIMDYLGHDLGWKEDQPYEILTSKVQPWRWGSDNEVVNLSGKLATAMRDNPKLRVLVMGGHTDLATPPEGVAYSFRHLLGLSDALRKNVEYTYYDGGHMFYLNPPDLKKTRTDLLRFIQP